MNAFQSTLVWTLGSVLLGAIALVLALRRVRGPRTRPPLPGLVRWLGALLIILGIGLAVSSWQLSSPEPANRWLVVHLVFGVPTLAVAPMFVLTCTARVRSNALFRIGIATFGVSIAGAIGAVELLTEPLIPAWTPAVLSRAHAGFGIAALSSMIALIAAWRIGWRSKV